MEPHQSGAEQTSSRVNDWEVVQLTASTYASAPAPTRPEPSDSEEAEAKKYNDKGDDSAAALFMSGHFSVSRDETESFLIGTDSKEPHKELCTQDTVTDEGNDLHKLKDDLDSITSSDKGKTLPLVDMDFDDGKALQGMSSVGEVSVGSAPTGNSMIHAEEDFSLSATDSKNDEKAEDSTLHKVNTFVGPSKAVASGELSKRDGSGPPRDAWWKKQLLSLYKNAKGSSKFWPVVAAAAALMGMAYFGRRWHKSKLQLHDVKFQPSNGKEKVNHAGGPLNRIKDILVAGITQALVSMDMPAGLS